MSPMKEFQSDMVHAFDKNAPEDHRGILYVPPFLLVDALWLPNGAEIVGAAWDFASKRIVLHVAHPDLPQVPQGCPAPTVNVMIAQHIRPAAEGEMIKSYTSQWA